MSKTLIGAAEHPAQLNYLTGLFLAASATAAALAVLPAFAFRARFAATAITPAVFAFALRTRFAATALAVFSASALTIALMTTTAGLAGRGVRMVAKLRGILGGTGHDGNARKDASSQAENSQRQDRRQDKRIVPSSHR